MEKMLQMAPFTHVVKLLDLLSLTHTECFSCFKNGFLHLYVHNLLSCSHHFIPHSKIPSFQNPLKALFLVKGNQTNILENIHPLCTILFTAPHQFLLPPSTPHAHAADKLERGAHVRHLRIKQAKPFNPSY